MDDAPASPVTVHVGRRRTVPAGRTPVTTAIWKNPVVGRVAVRGVNLDGDDQADRTVHGGPDKAVYAYAQDEQQLWTDELGRDLGEAPFGQNLTTRGVEGSSTGHGRHQPDGLRRDAARSRVDPAGDAGAAAARAAAGLAGAAAAVLVRPGAPSLRRAPRTTVE